MKLALQTGNGADSLVRKHIRQVTIFVAALHEILSQFLRFDWILEVSSNHGSLNT